MQHFVNLVEQQRFVRFLNQPMPVEKHSKNKKPKRGCYWEIRKQTNKSKVYLTIAMVIGLPIYNHGSFLT